MNIIFISPNFPLHFWNFCDRLRRLGANVLGIGDCPYESLANEVKSSVTEYYHVSSLEDYREVYRAAAYYAWKYGKIDHVESQNEYWLALEARLRDDFNVPFGLRSKDMAALQRKSQMKLAYKAAGVKTAGYRLIESRAGAREFASWAGYPVIIKPDRGVGASHTYKVTNDEELRKVLQEIPADGSYIMEEYVPGHVETFDGITNADGNVLFYTGQVMAVTPLDMLSGAGENVSWTQPVEKVDDLRDAGFRTLKDLLKNKF